MGVDVFDIVAVILGVWFNIRKLDAQSRESKDFPGVSAQAFLDWQTGEVSAYRVGSLGCFAKFFVDLLFTHFFAATLPFSVARAVGAGIDLSWLALLVVTFVRTSAARRRRRELGIVLGGFTVERSEATEAGGGAGPAAEPAVGRGEPGPEPEAPGSMEAPASSGQPAAPSERENHSYRNRRRP